MRPEDAITINGGLMAEEIDDRIKELNAITDVMIGHMIPVEMLRGIAEMVDGLDDDDPQVIPILNGLEPVAILWRNDCENPEHAHAAKHWELIPLLQLRTPENPQDLEKMLQALGNLIADAVIAGLEQAMRQMGDDNA